MDDRGGVLAKVLIVDDHEVLAESLGEVIDSEPGLRLVGSASTLARARELLPEVTPDVVLLDHGLPDGDGVAEIPTLLALLPGVQIVVLTASTDDRLLVAAIEAGAAGFISKSRGVQEVTAAVRAAANGEAVISPEMLARLLPRLRRGDSGHGQQLTIREQEVLTLLADGMSNAAIADQLTLSVNTVRNHISNLSGKLGAHSKLEALSIAIRDGLLPGR